MKKKHYLLIVFLMVLKAQAATIVSTGSGGSWTSPATWQGGVVPASTDEVLIAPGTTVTTGGARTCARLEVSGTLTMSGSSLIVNGDLLINSGGTFSPGALSFVVAGNYTNNGTAQLQLCTMRMTQPTPAVQTSISGTLGIVRNLRIDNPSGVNLLSNMSISASLSLMRGTFTNDTRLTLSNLNRGGGTQLSSVTLTRQAGALASPYTLGSGASVSIVYSGSPTLITPDNELPASKVLYALSVNTPGGVALGTDITLTSSNPLTLTDGVVTVASGKTIICSDVDYMGTSGTSTSYINGGMALVAGRVPVIKTFPLGSGGQNRAVTLTGLTAVATLTTQVKTVTVRFSTEAANSGTGAANVALSPAGRWHGSIMAGGLDRFSSISLKYGSSDNITDPSAIAISQTPGGTYSSLGLGTNTGSELVSPVRNYSSLGYYALGTGTGVNVRPLTKYSTSTGGPWNSTTTWVGGMVPSRTDTAVIVGSATVTLNVNAQMTGPLEIEGTLATTSGWGFAVNGDFEIKSGGKFFPSNNSFVVHGSFINNGSTNLSTGGTVIRMGSPDAGYQTLIGGSGNYGLNVVRNFRIDNPAGVRLRVPLSVSANLNLWRGTFYNDSTLTIDNTKRGSGGTLSVAVITRRPFSAIEYPYSVGPTATLDLKYEKDDDFNFKELIAGNEIPPSRTFNSLSVENLLGVTINDDIVVTADVNPLVLTAGIVKLAPGKTIICSSSVYPGTSGSVVSFVDGAVTLGIGSIAQTRTFPLGSGKQLQSVILSGLHTSSGTASVRFGISSLPGGAVAGPDTLFNSWKWVGSIVSGTLAGYSSISLTYGPYDNVNALTKVFQAPSNTGLFTSMGTGVVDTTKVQSPQGVFTTLGYFALGGTPVSFTDKIESAVLANAIVKQYEKAEWDLGISSLFSNPYDPAEIAVDMILLSPTNKRLQLPCFYFADKGLAISKWKARFSAKEIGTYTYKFILTKNGVKIDSTAISSFVSNAGNKDGILHFEKSNPWVLYYDSGKPFRGVGQNIGYEPLTYEDQKDTYDLYLPLIKENGANYFRTFMNNTNLPIEWNFVEMEKRSYRYKNSSEVYNPGGIKRMEELVNMSDSLGLHIQLMIEWQGNLREFRNYWAHNPYNKLNGGPAEYEEEFFTHPEAKRRFKNRMRFMIARWGYSPAIGMWELMNEVDNAVYYTVSDDATVPYQSDSVIISHAAVTNWHNEIATYIKENDPFDHIVTTSIGFKEISGLFAVENIDINQEHFYNRTQHIPTFTTRKLQTYGKPLVVGEFARDWQNTTPSRWDEFNYHFKRGLWHGIFNPTPVAPINWFWVHLWNQNGNNGFSYFKSVKEISDQMLAAGSGSFVSAGVNAEGFLTVGVKCGSKYYAHLINDDSAQAKSSTPLLQNLAPSTDYIVQIFDGDSFTYTSATSYTSTTAGTIELPSITLEPTKQVILVTTPASVLPVRMLTFYAKAEENKVKLDWSTAMERDNDRYEIERSTNNKDFEVISVVKGQHLSDRKFSYRTYDMNPGEGYNYYRLKQYDSNGAPTVVGYQAVNFGLQAKTSLKAYFSEGGDAVNFNIQGYDFDKITARVIDINGRVLGSETFNAVYDGNYTLKLSSVVTQGLYVLTISNDKMVKSVKILFQ